MEKSHELKIEGFTNPVEFVDKWSQMYNYSNEVKYHSNIQSVLDDRSSFIELFRWKNGTGNKISVGKTKTVNNFWDKRDVLMELREKFNWKTYEEEFRPSKTSNIWKIFLLHLVNPNHFPIYDQHVFRFYHFHKFGEIEEIPTNHSKRYNGYKEDYLLWFNETKEKYHLNPKKMDESFFSFGKLLKSFEVNQYDVKKVGLSK